MKNNASTYFESLQDPLTQEEINKLDSFYVYNELYDTTITIARQSLQKISLFYVEKSRVPATGSSALVLLSREVQSELPPAEKRLWKDRIMK